MSRRWLLPAAFVLCLSVGFLAVSGLSWTVLRLCLLYTSDAADE